MKKSYFIYKGCLTLILLTGMLVACREDMTEVTNPDSKTVNNMTSSSIYDQMLNVWNGINTAYVFWQVDTVDWDARRQPMLDWAKRMDDVMSAGGEIDTVEEVLQFNGFFYGLIDHHMAVFVKNPYDKTDSLPVFEASPGLLEVFFRKHVHYEIDMDTTLLLMNEMKNNGTLTYTDLSEAREKYEGDNFHVYSCCINDNIAYLRMSDYFIGNINEHSERIQKAITDHFDRVKSMYKNRTLKAIILDNRGNHGGYMSDLDWVVGLYISEPVAFQTIITKNGLGRYDYTPERPLTVYPNVKSPYYVGPMDDVMYVVLHDIESVSMGEISGNAIAQLNNGYTIGDRTWGGHGPLMPGYFENTYTGTFGTDGGKDMYVYTSTYLLKTWNWRTQQYECQEGKGLEPMIQCIVTQEPKELTEDPQLIRALQLINTGK